MSEKVLVERADIDALEEALMKTKDAVLKLYEEHKNIGRFEEMFGDIVGAIQGGCNTLDKLDAKLGDRYGRHAIELALIMMEKDQNIVMEDGVITKLRVCFQLPFNTYSGATGKEVENRIRKLCVTAKNGDAVLRLLKYKPFYDLFFKWQRDDESAPGTFKHRLYPVGLLREFVTAVFASEASGDVNDILALIDSSVVELRVS